MPARSGTAFFLSFILLLFLVSGGAALLDSSLILLLHRQDASIVSGLLALLMILAGILCYGAMALSPAIPKRYFLPVSLFLPIAYIAVLPLFVYYHRPSDWIAWGVALGQVLLGLFVLRRAHRGTRIGWPLFPASQLYDRDFRWGNLAAVVLATVLVLLPAILLYTGFSAQLAVHHFTDGFVALRPSGISMQVRKYVRDVDGRNITLVPMSHIGQSEFYRDLAASFPADSVVLMEGVSDKNKLLPTHLSYARMAAATGGVQQVTAFKPPGEIVPADVDLSSFSASTLEILKTAMIVHSKGVTPETLPLLMKPTPPDAVEQLIKDLLAKRNRHLLKVIEEHLANPGHIIVPWGAAHMPEIARGIQKSGFHVIETREFVAIRFGR